MISVTGGAGIVLVLVAAFFAEARWLQILSRVYLAVYLVFVVGLVVAGSEPVAILFVPAVLVVLGLYFLEVARGSRGMW